MSELKSEVKKFNEIAGNVPLGSEESSSYIEVTDQMRMQAGLILEEAKELHESCLHSLSVEEILKECIDVWVVNTFMETLLEACGIDVDGAKKAVNKNNLAKYTKDPLKANEVQVEYSNMGVPCYVESMMLDNSEIIYMVRRATDRKILKAKDHPKVDLSEFIPEKWKDRSGRSG